MLLLLPPRRCQSGRAISAPERPGVGRSLGLQRFAMKINSNENWLSSPSQASRNGHHILPGVLSPGLRGCGKSFLLALAACLTIVASGCGSRAADPATQTGGTGSSQVSPQLTSSGVNLNFGSVAVNSAATQSLTLTSTGTAPVMITSGTITGVGFTIVAQTFPVTLNPSQSLTLQLQFLINAVAIQTSSAISVYKNLEINKILRYIYIYINLLF